LRIHHALLFCPKGFAYVEFAEEQSVMNAQLLNDSLFRARQLKVIQKRTNVPGMGKDKGEYKGKGKGKPTKGKGKGKPKGGYAPWFVPNGGKYDYKGGKGYSPYY
jgi:polyadenylate-binding protein 2